MSGFTLRPEEIVNEFERMFPLEFRVVMLTITNRRQADTINSHEDRLRVQEEQLKQYNENGDFWKHDPNRDPEK